MKNLAIVGVTGLVGQTFLKVLEERNLKFNKIYMYASKRSKGKIITFQGKDYEVIELNEENIKDDIDFALFSAGGSISLEYAPKFASKGAIVIDNSSAWRMDADVPLIVPEVNKEKISEIKKGIIANPNCSTIQAMPILKLIDDKYKIKRIVYSTYQAVSGAGIKGIEDLKNDTSNHFPYKIKNNVLAHIDVFLENGYTKEEMKMVNETRKILDNNDLKITSTCVRVPVENSHSISVNLELFNDFNIEDIKDMFKNAQGIILQDDLKNNIYPTPLTSNNFDEVFVGRIRRDESIENGLNLWIVADNIRKGAATNAIQILELMLK